MMAASNSSKNVSGVYDLTEAAVTLIVGLKFGCPEVVLKLLEESVSCLSQRFAEAKLRGSMQEKDLWNALQSSMVDDALGPTGRESTLFYDNLKAVIWLFDLGMGERFRHMTEKDYWTQILKSTLPHSYGDLEKLKLSIPVWIQRLCKFFKFLVQLMSVEAGSVLTL